MTTAFIVLAVIALTICRGACSGGRATIVDAQLARTVAYEEQELDSFLNWLVLANALALEGYTEVAIAAVTRSRAILPSLSAKPVEGRWATFFANASDAAAMSKV